MNTNQYSQVAEFQVLDSSFTLVNDTCNEVKIFLFWLKGLWK